MKGNSQDNLKIAKHRGLKRILWAGYYSCRGIRAAWTHETAFRQEILLMLLMLPLAFWLGETAEQRILLIVPCIIVVICELINSAIEAIVDRVGYEIHELSGRAKDLGSAAVLLSLLLVVLIWALIAWQRFGY